MNTAIVLAVLALVISLIVFIWIWASWCQLTGLGAYFVINREFCGLKDTLREPANVLYNSFPKEPVTYELFLDASESNTPGKSIWILNNGVSGSVIEVKEGCGVKFLGSGHGNSVQAGSQAQYLLTDINVFRRVV